MAVIPPAACAIHRLMFLTCSEKEALFEAVMAGEQFLDLTPDRISVIVGRPLRARIPSPATILRSAEQDDRMCEALRISIVPIWSESYPPLLRETHDPPFLLFVRGSLADPGNPQCAIVGTRKPGESARRETRRFAGALAAHGIPVISGLAAGIDGEAHRGSLCSAGHTTGVLGSGIDAVYPVSHRRLAEHILAAGGAVVSEYPPGFPPLKHHFPQRNRVISGLSRWVVIMEAPERSGALITADYALDQGRELCVHAVGSSHEAGAAGTRALLDDGAKRVCEPSDLFDAPAAHMFREHEEGRRGGSQRHGRERSDIAHLLARSLQQELGLSTGSGNGRGVQRV